MKIDDYFLEKLRHEVKACSKSGVTSNPCRFFGGKFTKEELEGELSDWIESYYDDVIYPVESGDGYTLHYLRNAFGGTADEVEEALSELAEGFEHVFPNEHLEREYVDVPDRYYADQTNGEKKEDEYESEAEKAFEEIING